MSRMNAGIILAGKQPDVVGSMARGAAAGRQNALMDIYKQHGAGIAQGDQNALNALAQFDPMMAEKIQHSQQSRQYDKERLALMRKNAATAAAEHTRRMGEAERAAAAERINGVLRAGIQFFKAGDRDGYNRYAAQNGIDVTQYSFDDIPANAANLLGQLDALAAAKPQSPAGKLAADLDAGLITQEQFDAATKKGPLVDMSGANIGGQIGTIPQGYMAITDPDTGELTMKPIPGGPKDTARPDAIAEGNRETASDVVLNAAKRAAEAAKERTLGGALGAIAAHNPANKNAEVYRQVDVLKSNAKVENLNAMRQASPTGGALGAVSDAESAMLAAKSGALDPASPTFARDLEDYTRTLMRVIHGPTAGDAIFEQSWGLAEGVTKVNPAQLREADIQQRIRDIPDFGGMTDEELDAWIQQNGG